MSSGIYLSDFVDLTKIRHGEKFAEALATAYLGKGLEAFLSKLLADLGVGDGPVVEGDVDDGAYLRGPVYVAKGAMVEPTAFIQGPAYIGEGAQVRHGAYIRGNCYVGDRAVVGHTTEVKGSVFFDDAKAGHFAYVGDAILGRDVNLGAGTKLANLPFKRRSIRVIDPRGEGVLDTGLKKFSAILGDECQTGCNSVLSPGTLLLPRTAVLPAVHFRGTLREGIAK